MEKFSERRKERLERLLAEYKPLAEEYEKSLFADEKLHYKLFPVMWGICELVSGRMLEQLKRDLELNMVKLSSPVSMDYVKDMGLDEVVATSRKYTKAELLRRGWTEETLKLLHERYEKEFEF